LTATARAESLNNTLGGLERIGWTKFEAKS
jgi:hypothetical protein